MIPDPTPLNVSQAASRRLSVCPKNSPLAFEKCNVLLAEPDMTPRSDTEGMLTAADYCVTVVRDVRDIFLLRMDKPVKFAVLNDLLGPFALRAAAGLIRKQWPLARIIVIGCALPSLEDQLYDEVIAHRFKKTGFLDVLSMLMKETSSQEWVDGQAGFLRVPKILTDRDLDSETGQAAKPALLSHVLRDHPIRKRAHR